MPELLNLSSLIAPNERRRTCVHSTSHTEPPAPQKPHCRPLLFDQEADLSLISDQQSHPDALRADQECHRAHDTYSVVLTITTTSNNKRMSIAHGS